MLKAFIIEQKDVIPPRLHNLVRLAQIADLMLSDKEIEFLDRLSDFYIKTRYPETIAKLQAIAHRELVSTCINL
ncbi:MAG: HEPN domain-containing protein [Calditrichota bacterium]